MNHRERFLATIERRPVDYPCTWLGIPDAQALPGLFDYFGVDSLDNLRAQLDDDIVPVEMPYHSDSADAIYAALDFAQKGKVDNEHRTLNAPGFFQDRTDVAAVNDFDWPDPAAFIDPVECLTAIENVDGERAVLGVLWSSHFQDVCAAFGLETAFMRFYDAPDLVHAISERIVDFYLKANQIFFEATKGKLDAVLIGNDYGSQQGLMLSPNHVRDFAFDGARQLIGQAKSYDVKVIYHSCGGIRDIIPGLIDLGVDAIHPIQALAAGMEAGGLAADFGSQVSFCGGVDHQNLLVNGTADEVRNKVRELRALFPTGLIISPSHEAILPDIAPANIEAMFEAARE